MNETYYNRIYHYRWFLRIGRDFLKKIIIKLILCIIFNINFLFFFVTKNKNLKRIINISFFFLKNWEHLCFNNMLICRMFFFFARYTFRIGFFISYKFTRWFFLLNIYSQNEWIFLILILKSASSSIDKRKFLSSLYISLYVHCI